MTVASTAPATATTLATATTAGDGSYSATFTAPSAPGALDLMATPSVGAGSAFATVIVLAPGVSLTARGSQTISTASTTSTTVSTGNGTSVSAVSLTGAVNVAQYSGDPAPNAIESTFQSAGAVYSTSVWRTCRTSPPRHS